MQSTLSNMLEYQNSQVIHRYKKDYPNNTLTAEEAFSELIKYFWLCQKHQLELEKFPDKMELKFHCGMHPEMHEIDDMWHTFLLFTKDYMAFSKRYFGEYLHHIPKSENEKHSLDDFENEFRYYLFFIYDQLGEETVRKWFVSLIKNK